MTIRALSRPLRGIIVPLVTPLAGPDQLDVPALERLIEYLICGGVHGLFILGSTGEGPSISRRTGRQLIESTCAQVRGRIPVLVGITDPSYAESLLLARHAAEAGADAVVLSAPYYFSIEQAELLAYVQRLARESPLPLTLYNVPTLTRTSFELATVRRLLDVPAIVGMKDSSGDLDYLREVRDLARQRDDWCLFVGPEHLLVPAMKLGADGGVNGGANVWPQLFVQIYEAALAKRENAIPEQADVLPQLVAQAEHLGRLYQLDSGPITSPSVIKGLKAALAMLNICRDELAQPLQPLSPVERRQIEAILRELGLLPALAAQQK
jgi:dihydrodipicolinate synthase/N-acetylneuraminate lyase